MKKKSDEKPSQSKQEIKAIWLEKCRGEFEMMNRLRGARFPSQQHAAMIKAIEVCKIHDEIYIKHGIKTADLMHGYEYYKLGEDQEVKDQN
jgi:hypothetical protein